MPEPAATAICVDFGSTFTKASLVDLAQGRIVAVAEHPTTIGTDVLDGYDACLAELTVAAPRAAVAEVLACSSAGGGLRIAVVGNEELVTAEAGRRVALSSGGKVVAVIAAAPVGEGGVPEHDVGTALSHAIPPPDVVLLTGGTDGGNREVIVQAAHDLVAAGWTGPVVVAGNVKAQGEVVAALGDVPHVLAANVVPRIGVLDPDGARAAIREMFLSHVIGGKHLSARDDFAAMVRGATPDLVLTGVELLADAVDGGRSEVAGPGQGVVVVDVGGATTDVHSVVGLDPTDLATGFDTSGLSREVVATTRVTRTVEGDLGMRWSAVSTVAEAGLDDLVEAARLRAGDTGFVPDSEADLDVDEAIARAAVDLALRRHAGRSKVVVGPEGRVVERSGKDLRGVDLLIGSGGVLRHGRAGVAERVLGGSLGAAREGGWQLPEHPTLLVDGFSALAAVGLLAADHPGAACRLALRLLDAAHG